MLAARGEHPLIVEYLLANNVDAGLQNNKGRTALDIARKSKKTVVIQLLAGGEVLD